MENTFDKTALETIDLLEARLRRIEFTLRGENTTTPLSMASTASATERLANLEHALHQLASNSPVAQDLLSLHARYPDLFHSPPASTPPTTLDASSTLSIVLSSASSYAATSSQLTSVRDEPVPDPALSAQLAALAPRIAKVEAVQAAQGQDVAELRRRSAVVVERWYKEGVLGAGDRWAMVEGKVEGVEMGVRRVVGARREEV